MSTVSAALKAQCKKKGVKLTTATGRKRNIPTLRRMCIPQVGYNRTTGEKFVLEKPKRTLHPVYPPSSELVARCRRNKISLKTKDGKRRPVHVLWQMCQDNDKTKNTL